MAFDLGPLVRARLVTTQGEDLIWLASRGTVPAPGEGIALWPRTLLVFQDGVLAGTLSPERLCPGTELIP